MARSNLNHKDLFLLGHCCIDIMHSNIPDVLESTISPNRPAKPVSSTLGLSKPSFLHPIRQSSPQKRTKSFFSNCISGPQIWNCSNYACLHLSSPGGLIIASEAAEAVHCIRAPGGPDTFLQQTGT